MSPAAKSPRPGTTTTIGSAPWVAACAARRSPSRAATSSSAIPAGRSSRSGHEPVYTIWSGVIGPPSTARRPAGSAVKAAARGAASKVTIRNAPSPASNPRRVGAITSTSARARSRSMTAGVVSGPAMPDAPAFVADRTVSASHAERSSIRDGVSAATMIPWFCMRVTAGAGRPVRATWARRASTIARASGRPGLVYGTQSASSPNRRAASAPPSRLHVTALISGGCVWRTNRSGRKAWKRSSTDGRRPPAGARRAARAAAMTGSSPTSGRPIASRGTARSSPTPSAPDAGSEAAASSACRSARSGAMSSGTRSAAVNVARATPLGLMYRTPSDFAEALPPPPRENSGSRPKRCASSISCSSTAVGVGGSSRAPIRRSLTGRPPATPCR